MSLQVYFTRNGRIIGSIPPPKEQVSEALFAHVGLRTGESVIVNLNATPPMCVPLTVRSYWAAPLE